MRIRDYLSLYQPIVYRTITNSLERGTLSHAYLIYGDPGTPLLETATFLGKSVLCDNPDPLACEECITCKRINDSNYPDFVVYDGSQSTIKKEQVSDLEVEFDKTAFEKKGRKVYVMHLVENMTPQAVNAILKFLEEPGLDIYAFLTTNNPANVLPTIVSRCQNLKLTLVPRREIISMSVELGVPELDSAFLSYFYNEPESLKEAYEGNKDYTMARDALLEILEALKDDFPRAYYLAERKAITLTGKKEGARFFLDMMLECFEDIVSIHYGKEPVLVPIEPLLRDLDRKLPHIENTLVDLLKARKDIGSNVNIPLLVDHVMNCIIKE